MCPIYNYECKKCGNKEEIFYTSYKKCDKIVICKKCKYIMKKVISNTSFILKGGGWANDGYSNKK